MGKQWSTPYTLLHLAVLAFFLCVMHQCTYTSFSLLLQFWHEFLVAYKLCISYLHCTIKPCETSMKLSRIVSAIQIQQSLVTSLGCFGRNKMAADFGLNQPTSNS